MSRVGVHDHSLAGELGNAVDVVGIRQARLDVRVVPWLPLAAEDVVGREEDDTRADFGRGAGHIGRRRRR